MSFENKTYFRTVRITTQEGKEYIYDIIRKKNIVLTPEEWVRQQIIHYLIDKKNYPASLFSIEKQIKIGELRKRYDIVVYHKNTPWLIVECKAESEKLNEETLLQILSYNSQINASYLALTNGKEIKVYNILLKKWKNVFPEYNH